MRAKVRSAVSCFAWLALLAQLPLLWVTWCQAPAHAWNDLRTAPIVALHQGHTIYPTADHGVINTWTYGPLPLILTWPAGWARSAPGAVLTAAGCQLLLLAACLAYVCLRWPSLSRSDPNTESRSPRWLALALILAVWPGYSLGILQTDNFVIALGLLGSCAVARHPGSRGASWFAAICATGALACKQTALGIAAAHLLWLWIENGPEAALRQTGRITIAGLAWGLGSLAWFGKDGLWFVLLELPGRFPWVQDWQGRLELLRVHLLVHFFLPLVFMLWRRDWFLRRGAPLLLPALLWTASIPLGLAGILKIGGSINNFHGFLLWLPPVIVHLLSQVRAPSQTRLIAAGALATALGLVFFFRAPFRSWTPQVGHYRSAALLCERFPGEIWFPLFPTITLYSDHAYYHDEDGLYVRAVSNMPPKLDMVLRHLPPRYSAIALPGGVSNWDIADLFTPRYALKETVGGGAWQLRSWRRTNTVPATANPNDDTP